ncbi:MAG: hypothetical protein Fues2KO_45610 [Fuerstiella sp.]
MTDVQMLMAAVATLAGVVTHLWRQQRAYQADAVQLRDKRIAQLEALVAQMRDHEAQLASRIAAVEAENTRLKTQWTIYASSHDSSPLPQWTKDRQGIVLAANKAYERIFLIPRGFALSDYVGSRDADVWPQHIAEAFGMNDRHVLDTEETFDGVELVTNRDGVDKPIRIIKYPRRIRGVEEPIGVAGIAVPEAL